MNINRILCPIDFSEFNQITNEYASVLAKASGAQIIYIHVSLPDVAYGTYAYVDVEQQEARDRQRLEELKPTIDGIECSHVIEFGSPTERIVEYAHKNDINLIVMGTHGRTGLRRAIMGSVAESVVRRADCPVLALKANSKVPEPG